VHQIEWLGVLATGLAAALWAFPPAHGRDAWLAAAVLYGIHPLPDQVAAPLQFALQRLAVGGAEYLCHLANVRAWADGLLLRTGWRTFEIPAACSGMRSATTVLLLAFGLGVLMRLRPRAVLGLLAAAVAQALAINIVRIALLAALTPAGGSPLATEALHDQTGLIVALATLLTTAEALWLERRRRHTEPGITVPLPSGEVSLSTRSSVFFAVLKRHGHRAAAILSVAGLVAFALLRNNAHHRGMMIRGVSERLNYQGDLEAAERAAHGAEALTGPDVEWSLQTIEVLLRRRKFDEAVAALDRLPALEERQQHRSDLMRAFACVGLHRLEEAAALLSKLPASLGREPGAAMILAELHARLDHPAEVVAHLPVAAQSAWYHERIRALYPYLERRHRWRTIVETDTTLPHERAETALAAALANMSLGRTPRVALLLSHGVLASADDDPRLLQPLFYLAKRIPGSAWEDRYAQCLRRAAGTWTNPDIVYTYLRPAFELARPDLAWTLVRRIESLDPDHPGLPMARVRFGDQWYAFRNQAIGEPRSFPSDLTDLRRVPLLSLSQDVRSRLALLLADIPPAAPASPDNGPPPDHVLGRVGDLSLPSWRAALRTYSFAASALERRAPPAGEREAPLPKSLQDRWLKEALERFGRRLAQGRLEPTMRYEYAAALEQAGRFGESEAQLQALAELGTDDRRLAYQELAGLYERQEDWEGVYEVLREWTADEEGEPSVTILTRRCRAEQQLGLDLCALDTARRAYAGHPDSVRALEALVTTVALFDSPEEALFLLSQPRVFRDRKLEVFEAELLYRTERYAEAVRFCKTALPVLPAFPPHPPPPMVLPPAEEALLWPAPVLGVSDDPATLVARMRQRQGTARSPFLRDFITLWLACVADRGATATPTAWAACGRDAREQATALHHLSLLLARYGHTDRAREAAERAVRLVPEEGRLWRVLIGLSNGEPSLVRRARVACPADPELWLADLVTRYPPRATASTAPPGPGPTRDAQALVWLRETGGADRRSPAALTRAGEYLLRAGLATAGHEATHAAAEDARGLLAAHWLAVRSASQQGDVAGLVRAALAVAELSDQAPPQLYELVVRAKSDLRAYDDDMVFALKNLRRLQPANSLWAQTLGVVRYTRGGPEIVDAGRHLEEAVELGVTNTQAYVLAAEAARAVGDLPKATNLLWQARRRFPSSSQVLNNLCYTLAQAPETLPQAAELLPELLRQPGEDPHRLETAATVCLLSGRHEDAARLIGRIEAVAKPGSAEWFHAGLLSARLALGRRDVPGARAHLFRVMKQPHGAAVEDLRAVRELLASLAGRE
jgi:exosortase/archaeosortase family protein